MRHALRLALLEVADRLDKTAKRVDPFGGEKLVKKVITKYGNKAAESFERNLRIALHYKSLISDRTHDLAVVTSMGGPAGDELNRAVTALEKKAAKGDKNAESALEILHNWAATLVDSLTEHYDTTT